MLLATTGGSETESLSSVNGVASPVITSTDCTSPSELAIHRRLLARTGPIFWTGPVLASNRLWVASSEGEVQSVDVMSGVATPFAELNDPVSLPPVVANNTLYILDDGGRITAWR